jgi:hypothetical protein
MYELSSGGLSLMGTPWEVNEFVALEPIRLKHYDSWKQAKQAESDTSTRRQATAQILFDTILFLRDKGMIQTADAIMNSVSDPVWCSHDRLTGSDVIESVLSMPADPATEPQDNMFWFSWTAGRMPHQSWIIDRTMDLGGIWIAAPLDCNKFSFGSNVNTTVQSRNNSPPSFSGSLDLYSKLESSSMEDWLGYIFEASTNLAKETHCGRLFQASFLAKLMQRLQDTRLLQESETEPSRERSALDTFVSDIVPLAQWSRLLAEQVDRSEFLDRRAIFNVDGSRPGGQLILTPFQAQLESVPRAKTRNLSISWIVEPVEGEDVEGREEKTNRFRVTGMVPGMWRYTLLNSGVFTLV